MTTLTLDLTSDVYQRLRQEADRIGQPVDVIAEMWLTEHIELPSAPSLDVPAPTDERERAITVLRSAGLLTELSPEEQVLGAQSTATLEEVSMALSRPGGKSLSEIILEMRGPKG